MKQIFLNLKRFDVPSAAGGVNRIAPAAEYGSFIVKNVKSGLEKYSKRCGFSAFFPESQLPNAIAAAGSDCALHIGAQSVYRENISVGGNFGAFTSNRPAAAMAAIGCDCVLIGHCEERRDLAGVMAEAGVTDSAAVGRILNKEIKCAIESGLSVLFCIGESADEQDNFAKVLEAQLVTGLLGVDRSKVCIAYEPIWAIGPGKTPPDRAYIEKIARFVKDVTGGMPVVYGGGLKEDNAEMLASIPEIDGGLIALTRFAGEIGFYPDEYLRIIDKYLA